MQYGCDVPQLGGLRTICVGACDGYYFPISFSTSRQHLAKDAEVCQSMYAEAGQAELFAHTTNRDVADAVVDRRQALRRPALRVPLPPAVQSDLLGAN